ncbi:DUF2147 domain-containing protein [Hymenobacter taeanensis]|uniref:DUF2147 domain-containing protein n=1 Tax=Hymenobacter taeanensis TaxID=2735321 RepID=A0A6M6BN54_9BACT|nr:MULTISPECIES: DUF2147 domain-containing protein [Hymenobacter]QJX48505.1 DUF2147 domain-containing protein [Hymenobacter taeanensis]UOQ81998.1 DUF2147 domain-containing protein [Hymenobacter sp. 5414T-23]
MRLSALALGLCVSTTGLGQGLSPVGVWLDDSSNTHIELYTCNDKQLCGKLVWLQPMADSAARRPQLDAHNPDATKRQHPLLNLQVLRGLRYDASDARWEDGEIYDPNNGRTYSCYLRLLSKNRLEVKGYIGFPFIGRSHYWTRVR